MSENKNEKINKENDVENIKAEVVKKDDTKVSEVVETQEVAVVHEQPGVLVDEVSEKDTSSENENSKKTKSSKKDKKNKDESFFEKLKSNQAAKYAGVAILASLVTVAVVDVFDHDDYRGGHRGRMESHGYYNDDYDEMGSHGFFDDDRMGYHGYNDGNNYSNYREKKVIYLTPGSQGSTSSEVVSGEVVFDKTGDTVNAVNTVTTTDHNGNKVNTVTTTDHNGNKVTEVHRTANTAGVTNTTNATNTTSTNNTNTTNTAVKSDELKQIIQNADSVNVITKGEKSTITVSKDGKTTTYLVDSNNVSDLVTN